MTFTGTIGALCLYPLRAIIDLCVRLGVHPNFIRKPAYQAGCISKPVLISHYVPINIPLISQ